MTENYLTNHTVTLTKKDFGHICRCCLSKSNAIDNIFQLKFDETFLVDLFKLFNIQVNWSDDLPKTICASCTESVKNFYTFKKMYDNSVATLQIISRVSNEITKNNGLFLVTNRNHKVVPSREETENENIKEMSWDESNNKENISQDSNDEVVENKKLPSRTNQDVENENIKVEEDGMIKELDEDESNSDQENIKNKNNNASTVFKETKKSDQTIISPRKVKHTFTLPYFCKTCNKWITAIGASHKHSTPSKGSHVCEICGKSYLQKAALEIHYRIHKLMLLANKGNEEKEDSNSITEDTTKRRKIYGYQCSCGETFHSSQDLSQHKKEKNHPDPLYKTCEICKKTITYKGFMKHMRITHTAHINDSFACQYCESTFKLKSSLDKHIQNHNGEELTCEYCGSTFKHKGNLDRHIKIHTGEKPHVCEFCGKGFIQKNTLNGHRRVHTGERPFICDFCGRGFIQKTALINHKRLHTGEKPYLCDHCGKTLRSKVAYNNHLNEKHHDKPADEMELQCVICKKICSSKRALNLHMSRHGEKKFICMQCNKGFHTNKELDHHQITHISEKKVMCELCGKSFKHLQNLKVHTRLHTEQKNYTCKICFKAFRRNTHLVSHLRVHSGEKPFACPYCDKTFAHSTNREQHVRLHTGEKPYVCDVCGKEFHRSSSMAMHRQKHSKNVGIKLEESQ